MNWTNASSLSLRPTVRKANCLVGLENPSNYCFANVCIQICFHLKHLRQYFCCGTYSSHASVKRAQRLAKSLMPIFQGLAVKGGHIVSVRMLLSIFDDTDLLNGFIHHDSYEFLLRLLDLMDEELDGFPSEFVSFSNDTVNPLRKEAESNWNKFSKVSSIVKFLFYGIECSVSTCLNCANVYYTFEPNIGFSVALPQKLVTLCYVGSDKASIPCFIELAVDMTSEGTLLAESIVYQLAFRLNSDFSSITLCNLNGGKRLEKLSLDDRIGDGACLVAFELEESSDSGVCAEVLISPKIMLTEFCSYCNSSGSELKKCSVCFASCYCSKQCQLNDWNESHKLKCQTNKLNGYVSLCIPLLLPFTKDAQIKSQGFDPFKRKLFANIVPKYLEAKEISVSKQFSESRAFGDSELFHDVECDGTKIENVAFEKASEISCLDTLHEIDDFDCYGVAVPITSEKTKLCAAHSREVNGLKPESNPFLSGLNMKVFVTWTSRLDENHNQCKSKPDSSETEEINEESWPSFVEKTRENLNKLLKFTITLSEKQPDDANLDKTVSFRRSQFANQLNERRLQRELGVRSCTDTTLEQCLYAYFAPVRVSGRDCDNCHVKCDAIRRPCVWNSPHYLFIHFKRAAEIRSFCKLSTKVDFELENLDITPFIANGHPSKTAEPNLYRLHSVVQHHGSLQVHGHYTCYIRITDWDWLESDSSVRTPEDGESNRWYHFDDDEIKAVTERVVRTAEPYFLVYEKVSTLSQKRINIVLQPFNENEEEY